MKYDDRFKYLVGGYFGVKTMDSYSRKLFILKDIENYIKDYVKENKIEGFNYLEEAERINDEVSLREKLQDSLIVLNEIDGPIELILMIKLKVKELKYQR